MQWLSLLSAEPALPAHCEPTTEFLYRFSSAFHVCVPTPLAFTSNAFGALSIVAWLFAQLPQIYKNWSISSTSGLSIFFLVEWFLGDFSNLFGALFTHQAPWQVTIGCYYVFVDFCLVLQWIWYERLKHGNLVRIISRKKQSHDDYNPSRRPDTSSNAAGKQPTRPQIIFRAPTFDGTNVRHEDEKLTATLGGTKVFLPSSSSGLPSPSPRTILLIACVIHMATARASPVSHPHHHPTPPHQPSPLENAGTILSWLSTILYLFSRFPQLLKNFHRKSTSGLSPHLFIAAFCGNLCYSAALLTNPCAWSDFPAYGGNGWAGSRGNVRSEWVAAAMPFFLGAAGVLGLDATMGLQFLMYGESAGAEEVKVVVLPGSDGRPSRWRRVSGWMRGWIPSMSDAGSSRAGSLEGIEEGEAESLLGLEQEGGRRGYGGTNA